MLPSEEDPGIPEVARQLDKLIPYSNSLKDC